MKLQLQTHSLRRSIRRALRSLVRDERGMSTVEYVILLAVIVVGAVVTWNELGGKIKDKLNEANGQIQAL